MATAFDNLDAGNYRIRGELHRHKYDGKTDLIYSGDIEFMLNVYPPAGRRRPFVLRHLAITNFNWAEYTPHSDEGIENSLIAEDYEFRYDPHTLVSI